MKAITAEADTELITVVGGLPHGFEAGERVEFIRLAGGTGLSGRPVASINAAARSGKPTRYYVVTDSQGAAYSGDTTIEADDNVVTTVGRPHGLVVGDTIRFTALTGGTGLTVGTLYYVVSVDGDDFTISASAGGAAVNVTVDATAATWGRAAVGRSTFKVSATLGGEPVNVSADATAGWVRRMVRAPGDA